MENSENRALTIEQLTNYKKWKSFLKKSHLTVFFFFGIYIFKMNLPVYIRNNPTEIGCLI